MSIVATALLLVAEPYAPSLGRHQDNFGPLVQQPSVNKPVDNKDWCNGTSRVHLELFMPIRALFSADVLCGEVASGDYLWWLDVNSSSDMFVSYRLKDTHKC